MIAWNLSGWALHRRYGIFCAISSPTGVWQRFVIQMKMQSHHFVAHCCLSHNFHSLLVAGWLWCCGECGFIKFAYDISWETATGKCLGIDWVLCEWPECHIWGIRCGGIKLLFCIDMRFRMTQPRRLCIIGHPVTAMTSSCFQSHTHTSNRAQTATRQQASTSNWCDEERWGEGVIADAVFCWQNGESQMTD